jgi:hypothetical protein
MRLADEWHLLVLRGYIQLIGNSNYLICCHRKDWLSKLKASVARAEYHRRLRHYYSGRRLMSHSHHPHGRSLGKDGPRGHGEPSWMSVGVGLGWIRHIGGDRHLLALLHYCYWNSALIIMKWQMRLGPAVNGLPQTRVLLQALRNHARCARFYQIVLQI